MESPLQILQILSMIEEAAGTRMYESKKQSAQRTIEKKDSKLQEIETVSDQLFMIQKSMSAKTVNHVCFYFGLYRFFLRKSPQL